MAVKANAKVKSGLSVYQKGLLVGGGIVLAAVGAVSAVSKNAVTPVGVNEVKEMAGAREMTITGTVSREPGQLNEKDKYFVTTGGGAKYILIGLRQSYEVGNDSVSKPANQANDNAAAVDKNTMARNQGTGAGKTANAPVSPNVKQRPEARTDSDDRTAFEQFVGKRVTVTGFVVPVANIGTGKPMQPSQARVTKPGGNTTAGAPSDKAPTRTPAAVVPKASRAPVEAQLYDRFVVKSVVLAE